jgi:hypothetical protein
MTDTPSATSGPRFDIAGAPDRLASGVSEACKDALDVKPGKAHVLRIVWLRVKTDETVSLFRCGTSQWSGCNS